MSLHSFQWVLASFFSLHTMKLAQYGWYLRDSDSKKLVLWELLVEAGFWSSPCPFSAESMQFYPFMCASEYWLEYRIRSWKCLFHICTHLCVLTGLLAVIRKFWYTSMYQNSPDGTTRELSEVQNLASKVTRPLECLTLGFTFTARNFKSITIEYAQAGSFESQYVPQERQMSSVWISAQPSAPSKSQLS